MDRKLIDAIIHNANVASAPNYPGQKQELKDGAWRLFKMMLDTNGKTAPPELVTIGTRCLCGRQKWPDAERCEWCQMDLDREQDAYDTMNLARGL
jgi:hypothetical protein